MKRTERQVFCYWFKVTARARHATPPSAAAIIAALQTVAERGALFHERERGNVAYRIADIQVDENRAIATLLFRRCDVQAANAVYSNRATGAPRVVQKEEDEGGDRAAHMVVSWEPNAEEPHSYACHLEGVTGLSHRYIQATLNAYLTEARRHDADLFTYPDPAGARDRDGNPKRTQFSPSVELLGIISPSLARDLEEGVIHNLTLIDHRPRNQLGGNQYLVENAKQIHVKVSRDLPAAGRLASLITAFQTKRGDYQTAKIRFTDPNGVARTVRYEIDTGAPEQQNYIESYVVTGINPPMDESTPDILPFISGAMQAQIINDR